ncbi:signal peptidase I [Micrococcales bacterium 31B]|nr:signal peptidase I [Micrococcales bacterium 31B]
MVSAVVCVLLAVLGLRLFVVTPFVVPSASMQPLLVPGDRLLVYTVGSESVQRGEVIVFDGRDSFAPYKGGEHYFVKRVIGVAGDRVTCCGADGRLLINGVPLDEPYLGRAITAANPASGTKFDVQVPEGRLWLLGDNRTNSEDSRAYLGAPGGGFVAVERVTGDARAVYWPRDRARWLP